MEGVGACSKASWNAALRCGVFNKQVKLECCLALWRFQQGKLECCLGSFIARGTFLYGGRGRAFDIFIVGSGAIQGTAIVKGKGISDGESDAAIVRGCTVRRPGARRTSPLADK